MNEWKWNGMSENAGLWLLASTTKCYPLVVKWAAEEDPLARGQAVNKTTSQCENRNTNEKDNMYMELLPVFISWKYLKLMTIACRAIEKSIRLLPNTKIIFICRKIV